MRTTWPTRRSEAMTGVLLRRCVTVISADGGVTRR
jgi:hypothetical protein